nr:MAG TPA: hypothetical protein [Bacteriophage sp.]
MANRLLKFIIAVPALGYLFVQIISTLSLYAMRITALVVMALPFMPGANHGNKTSGLRLSCLNRFLVNLGRGHELSTYLCRSAVGLQK